MKVKAKHKDKRRAEETVMLRVKDKQTDKETDNAGAMVVQTVEANQKSKRKGWRK